MLATAQTRVVAELLTAAHPSVRIEIVPINTRPDRHPTTPLSQLGTKGLFTAELEQALDTGAIDLAVHSAKDVPTAIAPQTCIACVPPRLDPRDVLISDVASDLLELPDGAAVGTSSPRRRSQLLALRPDLQVLPIRGNIETRIEKVRAGQYQATLLAAAGLQRAGLSHYAVQTIPTDLILPAPGQAALAVQILRDRADLLELLAPLTDDASAAELAAERMVAAGLHATCNTPLAVLARADGHEMEVTAALLSPDGVRCCRADASASSDQLEELVKTVLSKLNQQGASELLAETL
jgi:hydroxymethylbilane synthase